MSERASEREEDAEGIYHSSEHNEKNILMMRLSVTHTPSEREREANTLLSSVILHSAPVGGSRFSPLIINFSICVCVFCNADERFLFHT